MEKKKILFVDDEEVLLRIFARMLDQNEDYEVAVEHDARLALQRARDFGPHVIFIDINMPEVEGSALASEIRSDLALSGIPIVFLSGAISAEEVESSGGDIGGQLFLAKPVTPRELVNCIKKCLDSRNV